jgi:hypothetical protein
LTSADWRCSTGNGDWRAGLEEDAEDKDDNAAAVAAMLSDGKGGSEPEAVGFFAGLFGSEDFGEGRPGLSPDPEDMILKTPSAEH